MKKYSITKRLLEDTAPPAVLYPNDIVTFGSGGEDNEADFAGYVPSFTTTKMKIPTYIKETRSEEGKADYQVDVVSPDSPTCTRVTLTGPQASQIIKFTKDDVKMKAVDFAEYLAALWMHSQVNKPVKISGPKESFDVSYAGGKWEVKSLGIGGEMFDKTNPNDPRKLKSARTGAGGTAAFSEGKRQIANMMSTFKDVIKIIDADPNYEKNKNKEDYRIIGDLRDKLETALADFGGKVASGEFAPGTFAKPFVGYKEKTIRPARGGKPAKIDYIPQERLKKSFPRRSSAVQQSRQILKDPSTQWTPAMLNLFDIKALFLKRSMDCFVPEAKKDEHQAVFDVMFGSTSEGTKRQRGSAVAGVYKNRKAIFRGTADNRLKILKCRIIDAIHDVFLIGSKITDFLRNMIRMVPSIAGNMGSKLGAELRAESTAALCDAYASHVPGFSGFIFITGVGSGTDISSGEITMWILPIEEARKAESGLILGAEITQGSPKISFMGHAFAIEAADSEPVRSAIEDHYGRYNLTNILQEDCEAMILGDPIGTPHREEIKSNSREGIKSKAKLFRIAQKSQSMHDRLLDDDNLPEWVQDMITTSEDRLRAAYDYIEYKLQRMKTDGVKLTEARKRKLIKDMLKVI